MYIQARNVSLQKWEGTGQSRRVYGTGPGGSCPFWERCWEWHKLETIVHGDNNATILLDILGSLYFDAQLCDHFWNGPGWKPLYIAIRRQRLPGDNIATLGLRCLFPSKPQPLLSPNSAYDCCSCCSRSTAQEHASSAPSSLFAKLPAQEILLPTTVVAGAAGTAPPDTVSSSDSAALAAELSLVPKGWTPSAESQSVFALGST